MRTNPFVLLLVLCVMPLPSLAASYETHEHIRDVARQHALDKTQGLPGKVEITAGNLDRRLRLAACDKPLTAYDSPNGLKPGRNVVGVRCEGQKPWKIFVPVEIATLETVVVATHPIARGKLLGTKDLKLELRDTARLHKAYYTTVTPLLGLKARRRISAGRVLDPNSLQQRQLVKRGTTVQILANQGSLEVRMKGKALDNGTQGERIRVRNLSSGREITGEVVASGVIQVIP